MSVVIVTFRGGTNIYFVRQCINQRQGLTAKAGIPIRGLVGESVPLERIASIETVIGPEWVTREWMERCVVVPCGVSGRDIGRFVAPSAGGDRPAIGTFREWLVRGTARDLAIEETSARCLRTIIMTALVASRGVIPMAVSKGTNPLVQRP